MMEKIQKKLFYYYCSMRNNTLLLLVLTRLLCHTLHKKSTLDHEKRPHVIVGSSSPHKSELYY